MTELDLDAASRQRLSIHDLDHDDECRLFHSVFFDLRVGQVQGAQELASRCGRRLAALPRPEQQQRHARRRHRPPETTSTGTSGSAPAGKRRRIRRVRSTSAPFTVH
ncbi:hypothetical protein MTO96_025623 [Rhipicephalus appendiculatus]